MRHCVEWKISTPDHSNRDRVTLSIANGSLNVKRFYVLRNQNLNDNDDHFNRIEHRLAPWRRLSPCRLSLRVPSTRVQPPTSWGVCCALTPDDGISTRVLRETKAMNNEQWDNEQWSLRQWKMINKASTNCQNICTRYDQNIHTHPQNSTSNPQIGKFKSTGHPQHESMNNEEWNNEQTPAPIVHCSSSHCSFP